MKKWYESAFERSYLERYAHRDEDEAGEDIRRVIELIHPPMDLPLLDLGCGAGRHLISLQGAGFASLTGIDLSQDLLDVARERLAEAGTKDVRLIRADMREIPESDYYATVLSMFTSFGYFDRDEENERVFHAIFRCLRSKGTFLLDTLNPPRIVSELVADEERTQGSQRLFIKRSITPDGKRVEKETLVKSPAADFVYRESVRMYSADEMSSLLRKVGFDEIRSYGSLSAETYSETSPRLVLVARKGAAA